jgi:hypothetical protein
VKVVEKVPVSYRPFADVKAELLKREQDTQFQKKLGEYLDKLKRDAVIRVNAEAQPYYTPPVPAPGSVVNVSSAAAPGTESSGVQTLPEATKASRDPAIEITPTAGWRFGGRTAQPGTATVDTVKIQDSLSWGAAIEVPVASWGALEALWSHQNSELRASFNPSAAAGLDPKLAHLNTDTFQLGGLWQSGDAESRARLYFDILFGVTLLTPSPELPSLKRFSASAGGGVKYYFANHIGLRLGARWLGVYVNPAEGAYESCSDTVGCATYYGTRLVSQGDAYGGLILRF